MSNSSDAVGATGSQGLQSATGSQGPIGLTGASGSQGISGLGNRQAYVINSQSITQTETNLKQLSVLANQIVQIRGTISIPNSPNSSSSVKLRLKDSNGNYLQNLMLDYQQVGIWYAQTSTTQVSFISQSSSSEIIFSLSGTGSNKIQFNIFYISPLDQTFNFNILSGNSNISNIEGSILVY